MNLNNERVKKKSQRVGGIKSTIPGYFHISAYTNNPFRNVSIFNFEDQDFVFHLM